MGIKRGDGIGQRDRQGWQIFSELAGPFLLSRPDTTEPRMAVLMKPDDRLPVQWIRGSNVEQIIGGKRKRREWLSTFRLPVVSSSDRWWKRESASKRGETDEEDADKYYNSFIARMSDLKKKKTRELLFRRLSRRFRVNLISLQFGEEVRTFILQLTITFIIYFPGEKLNTFETKII